MDTISAQEQRQNAIQLLTDVLVQAGVAPEDAAKFVPVLVDKQLAGEKSL